MRKSKLMIFIFMLFIITVVLIISLTGQKFDPVKRAEKIVITDNKYVPADLILSFSGLTEKEVTRELSPDIILDRIIKHPFISDVSGDFTDSITFHVSVKEEIPEFILNSGNELYIVTTSLKIIKFDPSYEIRDIPCISGLDIKSPRLSDAHVYKMLEKANHISDVIKNNSERMYELLSEIKFNNNIELFFSKPECKVIIDRRFSDEDAEKLNTFWREVVLTGSGVSYAHIDARFKDRIITIENSINKDSQ